MNTPIRPNNRPLCCAGMGHTIIAILVIVVSFRVPNGRADHEDYAYVPGASAPKHLRPGPGSDLSGMDLRDSAFVGMDLSHASFEGSILRNARFGQVRFEAGGVSFRGADLRGATFYQTLIHRASDFTDALINGARFDLTDKHFLSVEQLRTTRSYELKDLREVMIIGRRRPLSQWKAPGIGDLHRFALDLRGFDLRDATFWYGDFTESDFTDADLRGVWFIGSRVHPHQIMAARISLADDVNSPFGDIAIKHREFPNRPFSTTRRPFLGMGFVGMDLRGWDFAKADLRDVVLRHVDATGVDFTGADIRGVISIRAMNAEQVRSTLSYQIGDLSGASFRETDFSNFDFSKLNLTGASFYGGSLANADFSEAVITGAVFRGTRNSITPCQLKSTWNYKHGRMEGIVLPEGLLRALKNQ